MAIEALQSVDSTRKHFLENVLSILGYFNKQIINKDTLYVAGLFNEAIFNVTVNFGNAQAGGRSFRPSLQSVLVEICRTLYCFRPSGFLDCEYVWADYWDGPTVSPYVVEWWLEGGSGGGGGGGTPPPPPPPPYDPYDADIVIIDTSITNNFPCVTRIIDSLSGYANINAVAQVALNTVFGLNEKIHLKYKINPAWTQHDDDGDTSPDSSLSVMSDFYATIRLNPWLLSHATEEYIAATIIHEAVHAYIDYKYYEYLHGLNGVDSTAFKTLFKIYWPPKTLGFANNTYYYNVANSSEHQAMAANLISIMTEPLKILYPNTGIAGSLRDSIYNGLTWGGLQYTIVYQTKDTFSLKAINQMARDTSMHAPFSYPGSPTYTFDSHNLNMKKGCH